MRTKNEKNVSFLLKLSEKEKEILKNKADALGLEPTSYLRMLIRIIDTGWVSKIIQQEGIIGKEKVCNIIKTKELRKNPTGKEVRK